MLAGFGSVIRKSRICNRPNETSPWGVIRPVLAQDVKGGLKGIDSCKLAGTELGRSEFGGVDELPDGLRERNRRRETGKFDCVL